MQNRENEVRDGKKPRSKDLTWHGLRYKRAQEQYAMYEAEGRQNPKLMTSEILGHHRTDIMRTPAQWCRHSAGHGALIPASWCTLSAEDGASVPLPMVHGGRRRWCTAAMLGLSL